MRIGNLERHFCVASGSILLITGVIKTISFLQDGKYLMAPDSLFTFLSNRQFLFFAALGELSVVVAIITVRDIFFKVKLIAWLSTLFALYHFGVAWTEAPRLCPCLGGFADWMHLSRARVSTAMFSLAIFMLVCSYSLLVLHWSMNRHKTGGLDDTPRRNTLHPSSDI